MFFNSNQCSCASGIDTKQGIQIVCNGATVTTRQMTFHKSNRLLLESGSRKGGDTRASRLHLAEDSVQASRWAAKEKPLESREAELSVPKMGP